MDKRRFVLPALCAILLFTAGSCSGKKEKEAKQKSAEEIIHEYTRTLATAPQKARRAEEAVERKAAEEEKAIKELE